MEQLTRQAQTVAKQIEDLTPSAKKPKKKREQFGNTEQTELPIVEQVFLLDDADAVCTSCGGELRPWIGEFETSEMVDVVEVSYRVVKVNQQKYRCSCGGCIETAPVPSASRRAAATRSTSR